MSKIIIDKEFEELIPPLSEFEYEKLRLSIIAYGCRDPLVVWKDENILLDGHNRYRICTENDIEFKVERIMKTSRQTAKNWMILNQLGRRNLSPDAASLLRGKIYLGQKKDHGGDHGQQKAKKDQENPSGQNDHQPKTEEIVAKQTGVAPRTIRRDAKFAEAVEEKGLTGDVLAGKVKRRDVMKPPEVPREWDWDKELFTILTYLRRKFGDVPVTVKADFWQQIIESKDQIL